MTDKATKNNIMFSFPKGLSQQNLNFIISKLSASTGETGVDFFINEEGIDSTSNENWSLDVPTITVITGSTIAIAKILLDIVKILNVTIEVKNGDKSFLYRGVMNKEIKKRLLATFNLNEFDITETGSEKDG